MSPELTFRGRHVLLVGTDPGTAGAVRSLLRGGAQVTIDAPEGTLGATLDDLVQRGLVTWTTGADHAAYGVVIRARADTTPAAAPVAGGRPVGRVTLVGGGLGDPGLLTVAGLEAICTADVIVHDRLAPLDALRHVRADAVVIDVGKIPRGDFTPQETINAVLVEHALAALLRRGAGQREGQAHEAQQRLVDGREHLRIEVVVRRVDDPRVEREVLLGDHAAFAHALRERLVRLDDRAELLGRPAQRGEPCGVALEREAHFLAAKVRCDVLRARVGADPGRRLRADEGAEPLVRDDEAVGAQAQQRLAHDRPRHAPRLADLHLGRQPVADGVVPRHDLVEHAAVDLVGQARALAGRRRRLGTASGWSRTYKLRRRAASSLWVRLQPDAFRRHYVPTYAVFTVV